MRNLLKELEEKDLSTEVAEIVQKNKAEIELLEKNQLKYKILNVTLVLFGIALCGIPGMAITASGELSVLTFFLLPSFGFIVLILGAIYGKKYTRANEQINKMHDFTNPKYTEMVLRETLRKELLNNMLKDNWFCPHCAEPNPNSQKEVCSSCGKVYNDTLVKNFKKAILVSAKIPPTIK